jgi:hypothetical protein
MCVCVFLNGEEGMSHLIVHMGTSLFSWCLKWCLEARQVENKGREKFQDGQLYAVTLIDDGLLVAT